MPFKPKQSGNQRGRPKGSKNKAPREVVERILGTLDELDALKAKDKKPLYPGGYLLCMGIGDPKTFAALLGRCLPKDVNLTGNLTMTFDQALTDLEATAKEAQSGGR